MIAAARNEQDHKSWLSRAGLRCSAIRHPSLGHWCGYVAVPAGHPLHGKDYDAAHRECDTIDVHGGLTYARDHVPFAPSDGAWWFGFDCAHVGDIVPAIKLRFDDDVYRDLAFVEGECESLAKHLSELSK